MIPERFLIASKIHTPVPSLSLSSVQAPLG